MKTSNVQTEQRLNQFLSVVQKFVPKEQLQQFKLPEAEGKIQRYVVPISGGSDSTFTAMLMRSLFPTTDFIYVFTDTKAESVGLYKNLNKLEEYLDIKINRLVPEKGLFELIEQYGGFLPNQKSRWCTPNLKIKPMDNWLNSQFDLEADQVWTFVGLRADENRFGYVSEEDSIQMVLPLVKLGLGREAVYGTLAETIGISPDYKYVTRSSCFVCYAKRRSEKIGMLINSQSEFEVAQSFEKLTSDDEQRFSFDQLSEYLSGPQAVPLRHLDLFVPPSVDIRTAHLPYAPKPVKHGDKQTFDMFDSGAIAPDRDYDEIYVAVMFLTHSGLNLYCNYDSQGTYWSELATYSPTLTGLQKALAFYAEHKLSTPELYWMDKSTMRDRMKLAIFQIRFPKGLIDLKRVSDGSYTWGTGESYMQIKHHVRLVNQALKLQSLRKQLTDLERYRSRDDWELTWECEQFERVEKELNTYSLCDVGGDISWSGVYSVPDDNDLPSVVRQLRLQQQRENDEEAIAESRVGCVICSL